ncbi:MAG: hypothetical protein H6821_14850 [Planctomycetaceae bacterium]|nr:hypothetical protein [Planctomycetales bacterium]MCB9875449.1 hypothetical protein [Planctomycetaceae bacterium]MCB9938037.1 hypothetical protein [Planctomycetaceae bacterium]
MKLSNLVPSGRQVIAVLFPAVAATVFAVAVGCGGKSNAPVAAPPENVDPAAAATEPAPQGGAAPAE